MSSILNMGLTKLRAYAKQFLTSITSSEAIQAYRRWGQRGIVLLIAISAFGLGDHLYHVAPVWTLAKVLAFGALVGVGYALVPAFYHSYNDRVHPPLMLWGLALLLSMALKAIEYTGSAGLVWAFTGTAYNWAGWLIWASVTLALWVTIARSSGHRLERFAVFGAFYAAWGIWGLLGLGSLIEHGRHQHLWVFALVLGASVLAVTGVVYLITWWLARKSANATAPSSDTTP